MLNNKLPTNVRPRLQELVPWSFLIKALSLFGIGMLVLWMVYGNIIDHAPPLLSLKIALSIYPLIFLSQFIYLLFVFPTKEAEFPSAKLQHPTLILLSTTNAALAIGIVFWSHPYVPNAHEVFFLLMLPAAALCGLGNGWTFAIISGFFIICATLFHQHLTPTFGVELMCGYLLNFLLFRFLVSEYKDKVTTYLQLQSIETDNALIEKSSSQRTKEEIARNLHDELGYLSTIIYHKLYSGVQANHSASKTIVETLPFVASLRTKIRTLSASLHGETFDLVEALTTLSQHISQPKITLNTDDFEGPCKMDTGKALFHICQEAITNSIKHSNASEILITITSSEGLIHLKICDNGTGSTSVNEGVGLKSIRERLQKLKGESRIMITPQGFLGEFTAPL